MRECGHTLETRGGRFFDFDDPSPDDVDLSDIAVALNNTCRFGGFVNEYFSVLDHALYVHDWVAERTTDRIVRLAALHHDSHEAYIGDVPTPLKRKLGDSYRDIVAPIDSAIAAWLGIDPRLFHHEFVNVADQYALFAEARILKTSQGLGPHWKWKYIGKEHMDLPVPRRRTITDFYTAHFAALP